MTELATIDFSFAVSSIRFELILTSLCEAFVGRILSHYVQPSFILGENAIYPGLREGTRDIMLLPCDVSCRRFF